MLLDLIIQSTGFEPASHTEYFSIFPCFNKICCSFGLRRDPGLKTSNYLTTWRAEAHFWKAEAETAAGVPWCRPLQGVDVIVVNSTDYPPGLFFFFFFLEPDCWMSLTGLLITLKLWRSVPFLCLQQRSVQSHSQTAAAQGVKPAADLLEFWKASNVLLRRGGAAFL